MGRSIRPPLATRGTAGYKAVVIADALLFAMLLVLRVGQIVLLCGAVRSKNAAEAAVRGLLDAAVAMLVLWAVGAAFTPDDTYLAGRPVFAIANVFGLGGLIGFRAWGLAVLVAGGAVLGATAERARLGAVMVVSMLLAGAVVPLAGEAALTQQSMTSVMAAAIGIAAAAGGAAGLVMSKLAGPRQGKFNRDGSANLVPGHSLALQPIGLLLIAVGLTPAGGLGVVLGVSAAVLAAAGYARCRFGAMDLGLITGGGLAGLVAATATAGVPVVGHELLGGGGATAVIAGALAGLLTPAVMLHLEVRRRIDDVAGLATGSLVGGLLGPVVGLLLQWPTAFGVYTKAIGRTLAVDAGVLVLAGAAAWVVARLFARRGRLRVSETAEYDGLDLSTLDVNAYPDFQQTMIKSHHLRQL